VNDEGRRNLPFTLHTITGTIVIGKNDYNNVNPSYAVSPFYTKVQVINLIINTIACLDTLSARKILCETPIQVRTEYFRRKGASTIQVPSKNIYYVLHKEDTKNEAIIREHSTGHIEYTHAFKVRGHWRTLEEGSMGKDRTGNRVVKGYTWVTEYMKGEGELIKKIRKVQ
jgi:hypothetical protein